MDIQKFRGLCNLDGDGVVFSDRKCVPFLKGSSIEIILCNVYFI